MIHSYVSFRGHSRPNSLDTVRHAVDEISHLCGARDTVCGRPADMEVGPWVEEDPRNCRRCTRTLADTSIDEMSA